MRDSWKANCPPVWNHGRNCPTTTRLGYSDFASTLSILLIGNFDGVPCRPKGSCHLFPCLIALVVGRLPLRLPVAVTTCLPFFVSPQTHENAQVMSCCDLPRLLFVGDVPVEASYHSSALLFRLLEGWPGERLRIIESNLLRSLPQRRLPGIQYADLRVGNQRLLHTRFNCWYGPWLMKRAKRCAGQVEGLIAGFKPEAVLTVTHGFSWRTAARFAAQETLPLHLICHDDLPRLALIRERFRPWLEQEFGSVYRQATSRLFVSPVMHDEYRGRYRAKGDVLYPSRAAAVVFHASGPKPESCTRGSSQSACGQLRVRNRE